jgi:hypothetical protein
MRYRELTGAVQLAHQELRNDGRSVIPRTNVVMNAKILEDKSIGRLLLLRCKMWNKSMIMIWNGQAPLWAFLEKENGMEIAEATSSK